MSHSLVLKCTCPFSIQHKSKFRFLKSTDCIFILFGSFKASAVAQLEDNRSLFEVA